MWFAAMLRKPDDAFLQAASTSPLHEGPSFVQGAYDAKWWSFCCHAPPQSTRRPCVGSCSTPSCCSRVCQNGTWNTREDERWSTLIPQLYGL